MLKEDDQWWPQGEERLQAACFSIPPSATVLTVATVATLPANIMRQFITAERPGGSPRWVVYFPSAGTRLSFSIKRPVPVLA
jgi:hypothetical protein